MRLILSILVLVGGLSLASPAAAAPALRGAPLSQPFTPDHYDAGPNNTGLAIHPDGRLFVANQDGVLHFDGSEWRLLSLPGHRAARDIQRGPDGRLYVASIDQFGVLEETAEGEFVFRDLREDFGLDASSGRVGVTGPVLPVRTGVWFRTPNELFFHPTDGGERRRLRLPHGALQIEAVGDALYLNHSARGLMRLRDAAWEPVPDAEALAGERVIAVIDEHDGLLVVTLSGFFRLEAGRARRMPSEADRLFPESGAMTAVRISDGSLVVGTRAGELQRYDAALRLVERLPIGRARVHALQSDDEGGLWAATQNGLVRLQLPARWSRFGDDHGLAGTLLDVDRHGDALWIAGTSGLFRLHIDGEGTPRAERQDWVPLEAYAVESAGGALLVGHRLGLFALEAGPRPRPRPLVEGRAVFHLVPSRHFRDVVYASGLSDVWVLRRRAGRWETAAHWPLPDLLAHRLVEAAAGELWLSDRRGGPVRLRFDPGQDRLLEHRGFAAVDGFEVDGEAGSHVFWLDGRLRAASGARSFVLAGERFEADRHPLLAQVERPMDLQVAETAQGSIAMTRRRLLLRAKGGDRWTPITLGEGVRGFSELRPGSDGVLRLSTWSGQLLQLVPEAEPPRPLAPAHIRLDSVELRTEDAAGRRLLPVASGSVRLPTGAFVVIRPSVPVMESGTQMRFRIEGDAGGWTDWLAVRPIGLALRAGENRLHIEARTRSGREVVPLVYTLHGEPRWHEMLGVRLFASLALLGLAAAIVMLILRWRSRRYLAYNALLEHRISERTRELQDANRRLEELAVEDPLTCVANRRALEQGLWREWHRNLDLRRSLAVLMIDVDHFKRINDTYGHAHGDEVLRRVAALLQAGHEPTLELLARYGGEEFALLLPGVAPDEALVRAEALRARVEAAAQGVTVSIGAAACVPTAADHPHRLVRRADEALYRAKHGGRNRVAIGD